MTDAQRILILPKLYVTAAQLADIRRSFPELTDENVSLHFIVTEPLPRVEFRDMRASDVPNAIIDEALGGS